MATTTTTPTMRARRLDAARAQEYLQALRRSSERSRSLVGPQDDDQGSPRHRRFVADLRRAEGGR